MMLGEYQLVEAMSQSCPIHIFLYVYIPVHVIHDLMHACIECIRSSQYMYIFTRSLASLGKYFSCSSTLAYRLKYSLTRVFWTSQTTLTEGSTRASSSMATMDAKNVDPAPPYLESTSIPISCAGLIVVNMS